MVLSDLSIKRPVMMSMILLTLLLFGILGYLELPLTLLPEPNQPYIIVKVIYAGAGPLVVENQVTKKIEDEVASLGQVKSIKSYSLDSAALIQIEFEINKDENIAHQEVREKIDKILNDLPDGAEKPVVEKYKISDRPIMRIIAEGQLEPTALYDLVDKRIKDRIAQVPGVGKVEVLGGEEREIRVEFDKRSVFENNISLAEIGAFLQAANLEMPGGNLQQEGQEFSVRLKGEFPSVQAIEELDIPMNNTVKKLRQIAQVKDGTKEVRERVTFFDGKKQSKNAVLIEVTRTPTGNTVQAVRAVTKMLPSIEEELGGRVKLIVASEDAKIVQDSVDDATSTIVMGIILTALILFFFLHDWRSTLIVALAMPFSIIPTFMVMRGLGITLNILSLMGLSTASGILVANAVVVLENIFRHKGLGRDRKESARLGTAEVAVAVLASTLTNIVVFLPLANMKGLVGVYLRDFALTIVISTVFSLLISFTLTPLMASLVLPERVKPAGRVSKYLERLFTSWENWYRGLLAKVLKSKKSCLVTVLITIGLMVIAFALFPLVKTEFMPNLDTNKITVEIELPQGYDLDETAKVRAEVERRIRQFREVKSIVANEGRLSEQDQGVHLALLTVDLVDKEDRDLSSEELASQMIQACADIPNAKLRINSVGSTLILGQPIDFYLQGQDMDELERYAEKLLAKLEKIPGLTNINTSTRPGKPEITLEPDRTKMAEAGITIANLATSLRTALEGVVFTQYKEGGNEYDLRVVLKDDSLKSYEDLRNVPVVTRRGVYPISYFADLRFTESYNKIVHRDKYKAIEFTASLLPGYVLGDMTQAINRAVNELELPTGYKIRWSGNAELMEETIREMSFALVLAIILTFILLAATLEKFGQSLLILTTVPLCLIGVLFSLLSTGVTLSAISLLSVIMLVGMVVNNAILILDYANQLQDRGMDLKAALLEACPAKFKAILMSNLAAILGMLPMALGIGASGAEVRQPMGIVTIGGIISATILTLVFIPAVEYGLQRTKEKITRRMNGETLFS